MQFGQVANHRFSPTRKALELQAMAAASDDGESAETGWADAFGQWCLVAVPMRREVDAQGNVTGACEIAIEDVANEHVVLGTRDVRVAKYAQDLKPGECAFLNAFGSRLFLGEKSVALTAGGAFLSFDIDKKLVSLAGIPSKPGGAAPYLSISTTGIGLVSATGQASVMVDGAAVTISGSAIALDAGRVDLCKGANDPVVTHSQLEALKNQIIAWLATHVHPGVTVGAGVTGVVAVPPTFTLVPGRRVFAPRT